MELLMRMRMGRCDCGGLIWRRGVGGVDLAGWIWRWGGWVGVGRVVLEMSDRNDEDWKHHFFCFALVRSRIVLQKFF